MYRIRNYRYNPRMFELSILAKPSSERRLAVGTSCENLPEELLVNIFLYIIDGPQLNTISCVLRVCRKWYRLALSLLWIDMNITERKLYRLTASTVTNPNFNFIESFTLSPDVYKITICHPEHVNNSQHVEIASDLTSELYFGLNRLRLMLLNMQRLKTFSLHFGNAPVPCRGTLIHIRPYTLTSLLQNMPESLQNLELETRGYETYTSYGDTTCLCQAISRLLPKLRCVKLGLGSICSKLLSPSSSLESIVINTTTGLKCLTTPCELEIDRYTASMNIDQNISHGVAVRQVLIDTGMGLLRAGSFPQLQRFQIIDLYGPNVVYLKHDLLANETTSYPALGYAIPEPDVNHPKLLARVRDGTMQQRLDIYSYFSDVASYLINDAWIEDVRGVRHPAIARTQTRTKRLAWKPSAKSNFLIKWRIGEYRVPGMHRLELYFGRTMCRPQVGTLGELNTGLDLSLDTMAELSQIPYHELFQLGQCFRKGEMPDTHPWLSQNGLTELRDLMGHRSPPLPFHQGEPDITYAESDYTDGLASDSESALNGIDPEPEPDDAVSPGADVNDRAVVLTHEQMLMSSTEP